MTRDSQFLAANAKPAQAYFDKLLSDSSHKWPLKFFRRKPKPAKQDLRAHYRAMPDKKHAIGAKVHLPDGSAMVVKLIDLSAGGAAITFNPLPDPKLEVDSELSLNFSSLKSEREVRLQARIVSAFGEGEEHRYGLSFSNLGELFDGLDGFWFQALNRRKVQRALPPLDRRVPIILQAGDAEHRAHLRDVSTSGMSATCEGEAASLIEGVETVGVQVTLKKGEAPVGFEARIVHRVERTGKVVFGAEIDWSANDNAAADQELLNTYVAKRLDEVARWNRGS